MTQKALTMQQAKAIVKEISPMLDLFMDQTAEPPIGQPSVFMRWNLNINNKQFDDLISNTLKEFRKRRTIRDCDKNKYEIAVRTILSNLCANYLIHPHIKLQTPLSAPPYKGTPITHTISNNTQETLTEVGYIKIVAEGYQAPNGKGYYTRSILGTELWRWLTESSLSYDQITLSEVSTKMVMRNDQKEELPSYVFPDKLTLPLQTINNVLASTPISINLTDRRWVSFLQHDNEYKDLLSRKQYKRIFNNHSLEQGGRFYGVWWQEIKSAWRSCIKINGHSTVELDFKSMQPNMLAQIEGVTFDHDMYRIDVETFFGIEQVDEDIYKHIYRPLVKKVFNALLNAKSSDIKIMSEFNKIAKFQNIPTEDIKENWSAFLKFMQDSYPQFEKYFGSGIGVKLQYKDSQVAEAIMLSFAQKGIACLCVHDSFIVEDKYESLLKETMNQYHIDVLGYPPAGID